MNWSSGRRTRCRCFTRFETIVLKPLVLKPLVDTDVWMDFLRGRQGAHKFVRALPDETAVSVGELYAGVRDGTERDALATLIASLDVINITAQVAERGGLIRRDFGKSHGVGLNDALIAATAIEHGLRLCTLNVKHYPAVPARQLRRAHVKRA